MQVTVQGVVLDDEGNEILLSPQDHAKIVMGDDKTYVPISSHLKYPFRPSNIQEANETVSIDRTIMYRHPFFHTIYVSHRLRVFDGDEWKWGLPVDIPEKIVTGFISNETMIEIEKGYIYETTTNLLNGKEYERGSSLNSYPDKCDKRFYHPKYKDVFCDWIGHAYKETSKVFSIMIGQYVKFYAESAWHYYSKEKFAYECFNNELVPEDKKVEIINKKVRYKYIPSNLQLIDYVKESVDNLLRHPKFKHYGYIQDTGDLYSVNASKKLKREKVITIYNSYNHRKTYYNTNRFIYECIHQRLLKENEFMVGDQLYNKTVDSFVYNDKIFNNTANKDIYMSEDRSIFYVPYEREMKTIEGFINVGTKSNPKLIPIPE